MRVGIVNDMAMAAEVLRRIVASAPGHQVAWIARDGREAVAMCASDTPDLVLMDLVMPVMNGADATRLIMQQSPCAILVVTATIEGNMQLVFEAMGHGALDVVQTPTLGKHGTVDGASDLLSKVEMIGHLVRPNDSTAPADAKATVRRSARGRVGDMHLVVIGASTGGPAAIAEVLSRVDPNAQASYLVAQHVDAQFAPDLATWLDSRIPLIAKVAPSGCRPEPGTVWIAATNDHLAMGPGGVLRYTPDPVDCYYRPSVDVLFKSVGQNWPSTGTAVLLTGMGRDGAEGLLALRRAGWRTIAQDQASSVVFGMPKAAIEIGAAERVLPANRIGRAIMSGRRETRSED